MREPLTALYQPDHVGARTATHGNHDLTARDPDDAHVVRAGPAAGERVLDGLQSGIRCANGRERLAPLLAVASPRASPSPKAAPSD